MIILDDAYVSNRMCRYLELSRQPVLESAMSLRLREQGVRINVVPEAQAIERIDAGEPLYAMSESHFGWVTGNVHRKNILHGLSIFKDKEKMRTLLVPMYPSYFFQAVDAEELPRMPFPAEHAPFVLKPSVGFLSLGIYIIRTEDDWTQAIADIAASRDGWAQWYDQSVIGSGRFIMESLIEGTEYALDAYFDQEGEPHLLNILRHDFANAEDTADRLYVCGTQIMREKRQAMLDFLKEANGYCQVTGFPVHVEVRECDGIIYPVEFNALRFAGLGGTEISQMAFGFYTFAHYLQNTEPDWDAAFAHAGSDLYCMSVLNPPAGTPAGTTMDYDAFCRQWKQPLAMDRFDFDATGIMGFLFWKTSAEDDGERIRMLNDDLKAYLIAPGDPGACTGPGSGSIPRTGNGMMGEPPREYSPNRRYPNAARNAAPKAAPADPDSPREGYRDPENAQTPARRQTAPGAPEPPKGFNEENPFDNESNPFGRGVDPFAPPPLPEETGGRFVPNTMQKAIWSGLGFLFGFLGLFIVFILGMRQPATVRIEMLKWAGVGFAAAIAVEFTFLFLYGDQISGMLGAMGAAPTGTGSGGGSVF